MKDLIKRYPILAACEEQIAAARSALVACYGAGGKLLLCGNGGSAADCSHIAGELLKGFLLKRPITSADDALLESFITAAVSYAESYQHISAGSYTVNAMPATTEQAVIMLASHFYESRDGSTGGFFADNTQAASQVPLHCSRNWMPLRLLCLRDRTP